MGYLWFLKKGEQLGLFGRKPVDKPGSKGSSKWYYDRYGKVVYGERRPFRSPTSRPTT